MAPGVLDDQVARGAEIGRAVRIDDATGRYITQLKYAFPGELKLDGLKIVVDCAHGAAYKVAPAVFQELGATVYALGDEPDGRNINDGVGALYPRGIRQAVRDLNAHVGIALDGDADRVIFADENGRVVDGDAIMALCARRLLQRGELKQNTLVATIMSNLGLERAIQQHGGRLVRTQVGDRYVVEEMRKNGYNLGGEQSGHLIFLDHMTTGDGIIAALQVLALMIEQGRPLSELASLMQPYPQVLINVNSFALGARSVDPSITTQVIFTGDWSMAVKEAESTNSLADQGVDVFTMHVDGPKVVVETAAKRGKMVCGYHASQAKLAPQAYLTGAEWNWITAYKLILDAARSGKPHPNFVRGGLKDGFVKTSAYGAMVPDAAKKAADAVKAKMMAGSFDIFGGELKDNTGKVVIAKGTTLKQVDPVLEGMNYLVEGVIGKI